MVQFLEFLPSKGHFQAEKYSSVCLSAEVHVGIVHVGIVVHVGMEFVHVGMGGGEVASFFSLSFFSFFSFLS